jgi:hypothetical protein
MVRVDAFLSRILHVSSAAVIFTTAMAPHVFATPPTPIHRLLVPILCGVALLTGLYNQGLARPSTWTAGAAQYRTWVLSKIPLLFLLTPTAASLLGEHASMAQSVAAVLFVILGALARFTREANTLAAPKLKR